MPLSTEIFVMCIFWAGLPFYYSLLRDPQLNGGGWFLGAYACLVLSNSFTVIEEFWFNDLFNFLEHLTITISSVMLFIAIRKFMSKPLEKKNGLPPQGKARP